VPWPGRARRRPTHPPPLPIGGPTHPPPLPSEGGSQYGRTPPPAPVARWAPAVRTAPSLAALPPPSTRSHLSGCPSQRASALIASSHVTRVSTQAIITIPSSSSSSSAPPPPPLCPSTLNQYPIRAMPTPCLAPKPARSATRPRLFSTKKSLTTPAPCPCGPSVTACSPSFETALPPHCTAHFCLSFLPGGRDCTIRSKSSTTASLAGLSAGSSSQHLCPHKHTSRWDTQRRRVGQGHDSRH